jgi:hypothetical protein
MAQSIRDFERSFITGSASLATKQYYIVKQDTDGTVILAGANGVGAVGVVQNKPAIGAAALVRFLGTSKVVSGGTIAVGAWVTSQAGGTAVATTTDHDVVIGRYLGLAAAASGDIIEVQLGIFTLSA